MRFKLVSFFFPLKARTLAPSLLHFSMSQRQIVRNMWIVHLLIAAGLFVAALVSADCQLPCMLNHGCICNGTIPHENLADRQTYGTCTSCDMGWTGWMCGIKSCQNMGVLNKSTRACDCQLPWTGPSCTERVCPHSTGGAKPYRVLPVNNATGFCTSCEDGYYGLTCDMCTSRKACQEYHGADYLCSSLYTPRGPRKLLECDVTDKRFLGPLGPRRPGVGGRVSLTCESESPDVAFGLRPTGTCTVAFFRTEPADAYIDPFFFCSASNCTATSTVAATDVSTAPMASSAGFSFLRSLGELAIFGSCMILVLLQMPLLDNLRKVVAMRIGTALAVFLAAYVVMVAVGMDSRPTQMRELVTYSCQTASCICASDPANASYVPFCQGSVFESVIMPLIQHSISVACYTDSKECTFTPSDLQTSVKLTCNASECVNASRFPAISPHDESLSSSASPSTDKSGPIIGVILVVLSFGLVLLYRHVARSRTIRSVALFQSMFLSTDDAELSAPNENGNGREQHHADAEGDDEAAASDRDSLVRPSRSIRDSPFETTTNLAMLREAMRADICLSLKSLSYSLLPPPTFTLHGTVASQPLPILTDVTFTVRSGEMLALMGPSGAGKTTLLDIVSARGKPGEISGSMELSGNVIAESCGNLASYRNIVGYVSQEDTLLPALTVRETVEYAAMLKLPCAFSRATIEKVVDSLLESLGLVRCQHTLVGDSTRIRGVSGGERRRVSIAVELVANPRILFLDEPTSGLDACSAVHVMSTVATLARTSPLKKFAPYYFAFRPIVVFSIHQPSSDIYKLFDKVLLLSRGVVVYHGKAGGAVGRLSNLMARATQHVHPDDMEAMFRRGLADNPAEALMQLEEKISSDEARRAIGLLVRDAPEDAAVDDDEHEADDTASVNADHEDPALEQIRIDASAKVLACASSMKHFYPDSWRQWRLLTKRSFSSLAGSYYLIVCHSFVTLFVGTLMNFLYHQEGLDLPGTLNRAGSITFLLLVIAFVSLSALDQLLAERKLCIVERENGFYTTLPYLLAKVVVDIVPLRVIPVVMLGSVIYGPMGLRTDDGAHWLWFLFILVIFSVCITLMVMCIGIVTSNFGSSALLSAVVILWTFVFGGLLAQSDTMPPILKPMRLLSPFFLAFESLMVNELDGLMCTFAPTDATGKPSTNQIPLMCVQYIYNMSLHPDNFSRDVMLLLVQCSGLTWLCWILLAKVASIQR